MAKFAISKNTTETTPEQQELIYLREYIRVKRAELKTDLLTLKDTVNNSRECSDTLRREILVTIQKIQKGHTL